MQSSPLTPHLSSWVFPPFLVPWLSALALQMTGASSIPRETNNYLVPVGSQIAPL